MRAPILLSAIVTVLAPSAALADDATAAILLHVPPGQATSGDALELIAAVDGAWREDDLIARWRHHGQVGWHDVPFEQSSTGGWRATIPGDAVGRDGIDYYIVGRGVHFASEAAPHEVPVVPGKSDQLAEIARARVAGRADEVSLEVFGHQFGNRFGSTHRDQFVRGEVQWTHRMFGTLYATSFGFGAIQGVTPDRATLEAEELSHQARYGQGGVTLRLHPAIFVDGRIALGISHGGFIGGVAGSMTLGRPWATNLTIGAEVLGDLGATGYVRLQWDTAPPLLMGASILRTELPGAVLSGGAIVRYDVSYQLAGRFTTRATVSAGARDGSPHFGGGLGVAYEF